MYICRKCNHIFEEGEEKTIRENQGECFGTPAYESFLYFDKETNPNIVFTSLS